jgi:hypothetical protein
MSPAPWENAHVAHTQFDCRSRLQLDLSLPLDHVQRLGVITQVSHFRGIGCKDADHQLGTVIVALEEGEAAVIGCSFKDLAACWPALELDGGRFRQWDAHVQVRDSESRKQWTSMDFRGPAGVRREVAVFGSTKPL